jgi:hypothetical protein
MYQNNSRILNRSFLFRNKAMMKRKALIGGLRVGLFKEVHSRDEVRRFMAMPSKLDRMDFFLVGKQIYGKRRIPANRTVCFL